MAAATLHDVARRAGVSLATASRVLNGSSRNPRPDVVERVRAAAADLGYVANAYAQALARQSTDLIGLVVHDIADPYFSTIAQGVQRAAREVGRQVMLAATDRDPAIEREAVRAFAGHRTDAIILAGSRWSSVDDSPVIEELDRYREAGGRVAVVGQQIAGTRAVVPGNREGAAALAAALHDLGHRRFAILAGPRTLVTAEDRAAGFRSALAERGLSPAVTIHSGFTRDGGHDGARELLAGSGTGEDTALCVFAVNDVMAIGAVAAFRAAGLNVPTDVQIAGFDDIPTLRDFEPSLSTVRLPLTVLGRQAVTLAMDSDAGPVITVAGEVVLRDSTLLPR